jgi:hypothetical protein
VLDRLLERMREAYQTGIDRANARRTQTDRTSRREGEPAKLCECGAVWSPSHECYVTRGEAAEARRMEEAHE